MTPFGQAYMRFSFLFDRLWIYGTFGLKQMKTITATELARNVRRTLDRVALQGEEVVIERNHRKVAKLVRGQFEQNAIEAMADLYRTLPDDAAATWEADSKSGRWKRGRLDQRSAE